MTLATSTTTVPMAATRGHKRRSEGREICIVDHEYLNSLLHPRGVEERKGRRKVVRFQESGEGGWKGREGEW